MTVGAYAKQEPLDDSRYIVSRFAQGATYTFHLSLGLDRIVDDIPLFRPNWLSPSI